MKALLTKKIICIFLLFSICVFAFGQSCKELITNGDFSNFSNVWNRDEFSTGKVAGWTSARNTPQIGGAVAHTPPYFAYMWGSTTPGEGIETNVSVTAGKKYIY